MENTTRINMPTLKADDIIEKAAVARVQELDTLINNMADSLSKASSGKNLSKYWKTQDELIKDVITSYKTFNKVSNESNATELIKVTNALKAIVGVDLSNILPDFDGFAKSFNNAKKKVGNLDSAFDVKGFKEAFDVFETLKQQGLNVQEVFSHFGQNTNISELQKNVRALENEVENLTQRLTYAHDENKELRAEFDNFKTGSGLSNIMDELDDANSKLERLRAEAVETFENFLKMTNVAPKRSDGWGSSYYDFDDYRFQEYFQKIKDGSMTAQEAISDFKLQYDYLLKDSESNNNTFGLEQLQAFSTKLDTIFRQVEETSSKINDIISNGVIAKSVQNLSTDTTLSDSQRSLFGNLLQDEESLKSITALFQKLIEESNQTKNTEMFNSEQFVKIEELFTNIESHLSSIKSVLVDVGDGEELSPLLNTINNIELAIDKLNSSVKGIGFNMNIDFGSDSEMEAKAQAKISNALQAYQRLFDHIKMSSAGGSVINSKFFNFDINQFDTPMSKLQAYKKFIENMRNEAKQMFNGQDVLYSDTEKKYWTQASSAIGQVTKTFNEMKAASNTNPLENIFGKTDLTEVISQLNTIVNKLDEISISATKFSEVFKDGLNITTSVEEITTLTNKVKELETELERVKSVSATTTTSSTSTQPTKDAFQGADATASVEKTTQAIKEENSALDETVNKAKQAASELAKTRDIVSQNWYREKGTVIGKDSNGNDITRNADEFSFVERLKNGQLQTVLATYNEETGKWVEQVINVRTAFEQVEKAIISADNKIASLEMAKEKTLAAHPGYDATADDKQITIERRKRDELQNTLNLYGQEKEYVFEIEAANKRITDNQERLNNKKQSQTNLRQAVSDEQSLKDLEKFNNKLADTDKRIAGLSVPKELEEDWLKLIDYADELRVKLANSEINLPEYNKLINSKIGEYNSNVNIQQKRDKETFDTAAKEQENKLLDRQKQIWNELTTSLDRYATLQKRIASNNALSTDNEEAAELLKYIYKLQRSNVLPSEKLNESNKKLQQIRQTVADLKAKLKESTLDSLQGSIDKYQRAYNNYSVRPANEQSDAYKNALINLNSAIQELEKYKATLSGTSEVTENQEAHIEELVSECAKASDAFKQMSASQKGAKEIGIAKSIQRINKDLAENTRYSKTAKQNLQALLNQLESGDPSINLEKINSEIIKIENAEIRAGRAGKSFLDIFKTKAVHGFLGQAQSYLSMYIGFYGMVNKVRSTITTVKELDTALVDLKKTTTMTEQQLNKFYYSSNNVARQMGVTTQEIIEQASAWSRLGYSSNEAATEMAKLSSQFASISPGMDTDESQSGLVSIMKAWSINPDDVKSQIMDPINKLGKLLPKHTVMYGAIKYSIVDNYIG